MSIFRRLFHKDVPRERLQPLYSAIVAAARQPAWYVQGAVPDTLDGRFDMVAAMLSLAMLRLEAENDAFAAESALLAEIFVNDMDGQLREIGIGDVIVGKHINRMMGALGGRLGAYRTALLDDGDVETALVRNAYRGEAPEPSALHWAAARMRSLHEALAITPAAALVEGKWPEV